MDKSYSIDYINRETSFSKMSLYNKGFTACWPETSMDVLNVSKDTGFLTAVKRVIVATFYFFNIFSDQTIHRIHYTEEGKSQVFTCVASKKDMQKYISKYIDVDRSYRSLFWRNITLIA